MSTSLSAMNELDRRRAIRGLRNRAALVRALLDELDRATSSTGGGSVVQECATEQLAEELARLGCRMLESAAAIAGHIASGDSIAAPLLRTGE